MISNSPKKRTSNFQRTVKWIGILFGGLLFLKVFIGEWVYISSDSMLPTLRTGNLVWNSKLTYGALMPQRMKETPILNLLCLVPTIAQKDKQRNWGNHRMWGYSSPQRMDVIIFKWANDDSPLYIKRIIGMPKDTVLIANGKVYINHEPIEEKGKRITSYDNYGPFIIDDNCYFVMGDFRLNSLDSRHKGVVPFHCIAGKATYKLWNFKENSSLCTAIE